MNSTIGSVIVILALAGSPAQGAETVYPSADGTLVDGGVYGDFDGVADDWDWDFEQTGYQGVITLTTETPESSRQQRVVWEYDLSGVTVAPPVVATLTFTLRGVAVLPFPDVQIHIYAYPADLLETSDDFLSGPAVLQGEVTVVPFQPPTEYVLDVSAAVNNALGGGGDQVAFRFQTDPDTPNDRNQAFIDALDAEPATKPYLMLSAGANGDFDDDDDVDLDDYLVFSDCLAGPDAAPAPELPDVTAADCLQAFDFDADTDVDLGDFSSFQMLFAQDRATK